MIWVVSGDGILVQGVTPYLLCVNQIPNSAIGLDFVEVHHDDGHQSKIPSQQNPPQYAIDLQDALDLGLIHAYGAGYDSKTSKGLQLMGFRQLLAYLDQEAALWASRAIQLILWHKDHQFCSRCGKKSHQHPKEQAKVCPACHHRAYPRVQPCVIVAILHKDQVGKPKILLAQHRRHQKTGIYGLVAGFVEAGETLEQAVHREVQEEIGLQVDKLHYIGSQAWPYPSNLMVGFVAHYQSGDIKPEPSEICDARFFDIDALPKMPAFGSIAHSIIQQIEQNFQQFYP